MDPIFIPSHNYDDRPSPHVIKYVILHYTACDFDTSLDLLTQKHEPPVSSHYLIDKDGTLFQLVHDQNRAWHAGLSFWGNDQNINYNSLGIELVNSGSEPFPLAQMQRVRDLCLHLKQKYKIKPWNFLGHSDIAFHRKDDPGRMFDWKWLFHQGVGVYPDMSSHSISKAFPSHHRLKRKLQAYGYRIHEPQDYWPAFTAFRNHFDQDSLPFPAELPLIEQKLNSLISIKKKKA